MASSNDNSVQPANSSGYNSTNSLPLSNTNSFFNCGFSEEGQTSSNSSQSSKHESKKNTVNNHSLDLSTSSSQTQSSSNNFPAASLSNQTTGSKNKNKNKQLTTSTPNNKTNSNHTSSNSNSTTTATVTGRQFIQSIQNNQSSSSQSSPTSSDSAIILKSKANRPVSMSLSHEHVDENNNKVGGGEKPVLVATTADFLPQNLITAMQVQSLNFNVESWVQESKICEKTGQTIIETKLISRPMHPFLEPPRRWTREPILGSGSHFRAPYREAIYHNFENDKYEVVKAVDRQPPLKPHYQMQYGNQNIQRDRNHEITRDKNCQETLFRREYLLEQPEILFQDRKQYHHHKTQKLPGFDQFNQPYFNKTLETPNSTRLNFELNADFKTDPSNETTPESNPESTPGITHLSTNGTTRGSNNFASRELSELREIPDILSPTHQGIPRSATISNAANNPEMSSFVQNRRFSHGCMDSMSKKDIRSRAKAIKRQEEKERKRKDREHYNSANELSKSCIEHLLTDFD